MVLLESEENNLTEYTIPWTRIVTSLLIFFFVFFIYVGAFLGALMLPQIMLFKGSFLLSLLVFSALYMSFSIGSAFWMNVVLSPVRKWISSNLKCSDCGGTFSKCEYHHPGFYYAPLSFAVYCDRCKTDYLFESHIFRKTLVQMKRNPVFEIIGASDNNVKKHPMHFGYAVPRFMLALNSIVSLPVHILAIIISEIIFLPMFLVYVIYYNAIPDFLKLEVLKLIGIIVVLLAAPFLILLRKSKIGSLENYSIRKWILSNMLCPNCNSKFSECSNVRTRLGTEYAVHCDSCSKDMRIEGGTTIYPYLRFRNT